MFRDKLRNKGNSLFEIHRILETRYKAEIEEERKEQEMKLKRKQEAEKVKFRQQQIQESSPLLRNKKLPQLKSLCPTSLNHPTKVSIAGYCPMQNSGLGVRPFGRVNYDDYPGLTTSVFSKAKSVNSLVATNKKVNAAKNSRFQPPGSAPQTLRSQNSGKNSRFQTAGTGSAPQTIRSQNSAKNAQLQTSGSSAKTPRSQNTANSARLQPFGSAAQSIRPQNAAKNTQFQTSGSSAKTIRSQNSAKMSRLQTSASAPQTLRARSTKKSIPDSSRTNTTKSRAGTVTKLRTSTADHVPAITYSGLWEEPSPSTNRFENRQNFASDIRIHDSWNSLPGCVIESADWETRYTGHLATTLSSSSSEESFIEELSIKKKKKQKERAARICPKELLVVWSHLNNHLGTYHNRFVKEFPGCLFVRIIRAGELVEHQIPLPGALALIREQVLRTKGCLKLVEHNLTFEYDLTKAFYIHENDMLLIGRDF